MAQENMGKRFEGYQIYDQHYEKVGKVDDLFVDENDVPEYIGVKTGFLGGRSTLIPMDIVRVNDVRQLVEVASEKDTIKDGPSFGDDEEITADFEDRVHAHFGMTREALPADRVEYGAYHDGYSEVELAYGEHADTQASGPATRGPAEGLEYTPTVAGEGSSVEVAYDERTDTRTSVAPETHEAHSPRGREEELDATDAARRKARELGVDLMQVEGTGSGGRIVIWDVTGFAEGGGTAEQYSPDPTRLEPDRADEERHDREREEAGEVGPGMRMGDTESGEFRGHASDNEGVAQRQGSDLEDEDELRVQRSEEELRAGTREREAGRVNVRKRVRTDRERIEVPTRREEVSVKRVPVEGRASEAQIGDEEVRVPVVEDEVVVQKKPVAKEEIRVRKDVVEDTEIIEEDVRREEVEIEDDTRRRREG